MKELMNIVAEVSSRVEAAKDLINKPNDKAQIINKKRGNRDFKRGKKFSELFLTPRMKYNLQIRGIPEGKKKRKMRHT